MWRFWLGGGWGDRSMLVGVTVCSYCLPTATSTEGSRGASAVSQLDLHSESVYLVEQWASLGGGRGSVCGE